MGRRSPSARGGNKVRLRGMNSTVVSIRVWNCLRSRGKSKSKAIGGTDNGSEINVRL